MLDRKELGGFGQKRLRRDLLRVLLGFCSMGFME